MAHNWYDKSPMWPQFNHGCPHPVPEDAEPYNTPYAVLGKTEAGEYVFTIHTIDGETYDVEAGNNIIILGDTTYKLEASADGTSLTLVGSDGSTSTVPMYSALATSESEGLMSAADKAKLDGIEAGAQRNVLLGIRGSAEETTTQSGIYVVTKDKIGLGNVENKSASEILDELTAQDITDALGYTPAQSGDTPIVAGVTGVKGSSENTYRTGDVNITKENIGLGNVENKSSATILNELTGTQIVEKLGYTPLQSSGINSIRKYRETLPSTQFVNTFRIPITNLGYSSFDDCVVLAQVTPFVTSDLTPEEFSWTTGMYDDGTQEAFYVWAYNETGSDLDVAITVVAFATPSSS